LSLEDLGNIGEFVAAVGVIISLIYLAMQVRGNTSALRTRSRQDIEESFRAFYRPLFDNPELCQLYLGGLRKYPDLPQPDRLQFATYMNDHAQHFQGASALYESGTLDEEIYRAYLDYFAAHLATPGGSAYWSETRGLYPSQMAAAVDERLSAGSLPTLLESFSFLRVE
jgi:hypothetical protein